MNNFLGDKSAVIMVALICGSVVAADIWKSSFESCHKISMEDNIWVDEERVHKYKGDTT